MAIPVWGGVSFSNLGQRIRRVLDQLATGTSGLYITSSFRRGDTGSYHGGYGGGAAVDVGFGYGSSGYQARARALAAKLYAYPGDCTELIVSKVGTSNSNGGYYIKNGRRVGAYAHTGGNTSVRHEDHIHVAMTPAQVSRWEARLRSSPPAPAPSQPQQPSGQSQAAVAVMPWYSRPTLRRGNSGGAVGHLQWLLRDRLGYRIDRVSGSPFGPQTEAAVRSFQQKYNHIPVNGVVTGSVWAQAEVAAAQAISTSGRPVLRQGSSGGWAGYLQHCLRKTGYKIDDLNGFPFGPQTHAAVVAFQRRYSWLQNDGVVATNTWDALDAVERGGTPKDPSGGGSTPPPPPPPPSSGEPPSTPPGTTHREPLSLLWLKDEVLKHRNAAGLQGITFCGIGPPQTNAYGYHNSRARHEQGLTTTGRTDYSVQVAADRTGDPYLFSAIDLCGREPTKVMTARMRDAAAKNDPRLKYVREFYGTLNGTVVFGRIHNSETGPWSSATADNSHLFHLHISLFRKYAGDPAAAKALADVLLGR